MNQIRVSEEVVCSDTLIFYMPLMCVDFTFMLISRMKLAPKLIFFLLAWTGA